MLGEELDNKIIKQFDIESFNLNIVANVASENNIFNCVVTRSTFESEVYDSEMT